MRLITIAIDISLDVFKDNQTCFMYLTKDTILNSYILALPSRLFSCHLNTKEDYDLVLETPIVFDEERKRLGLKKNIDSAMRAFEERQTLE